MILDPPQLEFGRLLLKKKTSCSTSLVKMNGPADFFLLTVFVAAGSRIIYRIRDQVNSQSLDVSSVKIVKTISNTPSMRPEL